MSSLQDDLMSLLKNLSSTKADGEQTSPQPQPDPDGLPLVAQSILSSLDLSDKRLEPYPHWLMQDVLPAGYCEAITSIPIHAPTVEEANFDGRRNTNDDLRTYFNEEQQAKRPVIKEIVEGFEHPIVRKAFEAITGADLSDGHLRIEYCQDTQGFWLEPHTDISVKKLTMLVYLLNDPDLALTGTDIHLGPPGHEYVGSAPYGQNKGIIFIPSDDTWHGVGHNPIPEEKVRKSLIINYVTSDWRDKWELA
ncbi:MAG: 2OG-Fe(II) oxygenase [bacterium]|nr:2OG-Fe(II) oxygenase [bacterium]